MGKKKNSNNNENKQPPPQTEQNPQEDQQDLPQIEGKFLLGKPKFKKLENGRYKCVQTGHELPSAARDSYALTKHCRTGLIDYALARLKPPMNMFHQDPLCRSKLICKLTGDTVNKTEEHIWKHMNGKRFLHMLEKEEAEAGAGKETSNDMMEENGEQKLEEASNSKEDGSKKKKKKDKKKKNKKKKEEEKDVSTIVTEIRDPEEKDSDMEDDFWMPPAGDRWDFDDGKDRWASGSESDEDPENADANEEEPTVEESNETQELSKRTKRMSIEVEPSDMESSKKKKKKVEST